MYIVILCIRVYKSYANHLNLSARQDPLHWMGRVPERLGSGKYSGIIHERTEGTQHHGCAIFFAVCSFWRVVECS